MTKTFYQELRAFFMKYDPSRVRLSGQIAATYKSKSGQAQVMKRLREVYAGGGPTEFFGKGGAIAQKPAKKAIPVAPVHHEETVIENEVENNSDETHTPLAD
jgi:hypothetical protein